MSGADRPELRQRLKLLLDQHDQSPRLLDRPNGVDRNAAMTMMEAKSPASFDLTLQANSTRIRLRTARKRNIKLHASGLDTPTIVSPARTRWTTKSVSCVMPHATFNPGAR